MRRRATLVALLVLLVAVGGWLLFRLEGGSDTPASPKGGPGPEPHDARLAGRGTQGRSEDAAAAPATAAQEETRALGRLEVLVVRSEDGAPIPGASVAWHHDGTGQVAQATTDAEGYVRWTDLASGLGTIVVRAPGRGRVKELALTARADERRDLQKVALEPGLTFRGVVVDATSWQPLQDATVHLVSVAVPMMSDDPYYGLREEIERVATDGGGAFHFDDCSRWSGDEMRAILVTAAGHARAEKLVLTPDPLLEAGGLRIAVPPAGRVEGVLRGPDGSGVPGIVMAAPADLASLLLYGECVRVLPGGAPFWASSVRPEGLVDLYGTWRVPAGADGRFRFDSLPLRTTVVLQGRAADGRPTPRSAPVRVERETSPVDLTFEPPARLVVSVRGADGTPHAGAHVIWRRYPSEVDFHATLEKRTLDTNPEGVATFDALTPGPFEITAWDHGYQQVSERGVLEPGGSVSRALVTWPKAEHEEAVPPPGAPPGRDPFADPSSEAGPPARPPVVLRVTLVLPAGDTLPRGYTLYYDGEAYCGSTTGTWRIDHGPRLTVDLSFDEALPTTVTAEVSGYLPVEWHVPSDAVGLVPLEERELDPGLTVSGRVVDDAGRPVVGAQVSLGTPGADPEIFEVGMHVQQDVTTPEGRFRLHALPAGELEWVVETPWFRRAQRVQVRRGMQPLETSIPAQAIVYGRLVDPDGIPVPGVFVSVRPVAEAPPGGRSWGGPSDAGGQVRATVTAGRWKVEAHDDGAGGVPPSVVASAEVDVPGGGETAVVLVLDRPD